MNERIFELAKQAGFMVDRSGTIMVCFTSTGDSEVKKFAELIVRECAAAAFDWYENHHNFHWDPATHVLGHFGVE